MGRSSADRAGWCPDYTFMWCNWVALKSVTQELRGICDRLGMNEFTECCLHKLFSDHEGCSFSKTIMESKTSSTMLKHLDERFTSEQINDAILPPEPHLIQRRSHVQGNQRNAGARTSHHVLEITDNNMQPGSHCSRLQSHAQDNYQSAIEPEHCLFRQTNNNSSLLEWHFPELLSQIASRVRSDFAHENVSVRISPNSMVKTGSETPLSISIALFRRSTREVHCLRHDSLNICLFLKTITKTPLRLTVPLPHEKPKLFWHNIVPNPLIERNLSPCICFRLMGLCDILPNFDPFLRASTLLCLPGWMSPINRLFQNGNPPKGIFHTDTAHLDVTLQPPIARVTYAKWLRCHSNRTGEVTSFVGSVSQSNSAESFDVSDNRRMNCSGILVQSATR